MQRSLIIALILAILVVIFALQNSDPVTVKLWFWVVQSSVALVMLIILLIGAILGVLFSLPGIFKRNKKIEELEENLRKLEIKTSKPEMK
jgi:lipopolysaccharide assembly protein A